MPSPSTSSSWTCLAALAATLPVATTFACGQAFSAADGGARDASHPDASDELVAVQDALIEEEPPTTDSGAPGMPDACADVDVMSDPKNCGACGHNCGTGKCDAGFCPVMPLDQNLINPDRIVFDVRGDIFYSVLGLCADKTCAGSLKERLVGKAVTDISGATPTQTTTSAAGLPITATDTQLYWAQTTNSGKVFAIDYGSPTGVPSDVTPGATPPWPALANDGTNVYVGAGGGTVYFRPLKGTSTSWLASSGIAGDLADLSPVVAGLTRYLFWINVPNMPAGTVGEVGQATVGGGISANHILRNISDPIGRVFATTKGPVWIEGTDIVGATLDLASKTTLVGGGGYHPQDLLVAPDGTLYFTADDGTVKMQRKQDPMPVNIAHGQNNPRAIALDLLGKVYWVNAGTFNHADGEVLYTAR